MRHTLHDSMLGQVARTRRPYLSTAEDAARWNQKVVASERLGSFMHAPIELGPRLFGVLTVGHEEPDRFDEEDLELLVKLARSSAAGIANAIDFERERRVARALTLGFVPESLPEVPGFEVGLLYEPAANQPTGGDVYGVWRTPSGEVAVLVGDVAGKGVQTAALSAMARFFIEARSWDSPSPAEVLDQANAMLRSRLPNDTFVTAFFGLLAEDRLTYCNAGHLSPILVRADGGRGEPGGRGLPLGVDESPGLPQQRAGARRRRPVVRVHRRPDRGPPRGRAVRHRAPRACGRGLGPRRARLGAGPPRARAGERLGRRADRRRRGPRAPPPQLACREWRPTPTPAPGSTPATPAPASPRWWRR